MRTSIPSKSACRLLLASLLGLAHGCVGRALADEHPPAGGAASAAASLSAPLLSATAPDLLSAQVKQLIAQLPRVGSSGQFVIYEDDLRMTEQELTEYLLHIDNPAAPKTVGMKPRRCIRCYEKELCDEELSGQDPTSACINAIRSQVSAAPDRDRDVLKRIENFRIALSRDNDDAQREILRRIESRPLRMERAEVNFDSLSSGERKMKSRFGSGEDYTDLRRPSALHDELLREKLYSEPSAASGTDELRGFSRIAKKYYRSSNIDGLVELVPGTCKVSSWLEMSGLTVVQETPVELTYAIDKASMGNFYLSVRDAVHQAADGWNDLCSNCLFKFKHREQLDTQTNLTPGSDVLFVVHRDGVSSSADRVLASSFYPHETQASRYLTIYPAYFSTSYNRQAVMKHELGHILGLRHEHLRSQAHCVLSASGSPTQPENSHWLPFRDFDAKSIMHYACDASPYQREKFSDGDLQSILGLYQRGRLTLDRAEIRRQLEKEPNWRERWSQCREILADPVTKDLVETRVRDHIGQL